MTTTYERDKQTARTACGVRVKADHWASTTVHSHKTWTGDATVETWCGLAVDLEDGGRHTRDLISCLGCAQASYDAFRNFGRAV